MNFIHCCEVVCWHGKDLDYQCQDLTIEEWRDIVGLEPAWAFSGLGHFLARFHTALHPNVRFGWSRGGDRRKRKLRPARRGAREGPNRRVAGIPCG
ncbi:MAG: hypothetical protein U0361_07825 [Nitrospiraceae bacterium]